MSYASTKLMPAHAMTDLAGRFLKVDDRFCELIRRKRSDIVGRTILELTADRYRPLNIEKLNLLRDRGEPFAIRKRYLCGDGRTRLVDNVVSLLMDGAGSSVLAATVQPVAEATGQQFAETMRVARILLDEQKSRLILGEAFQGADGRLLLAAFVLEAEGAAVRASELAEVAGGERRCNLLRIWELVSSGALVVDGRADSLQDASMRISPDNAKALERHLAATLR